MKEKIFNNEIEDAGMRLRNATTNANPLIMDEHQNEEDSDSDYILSEFSDDSDAEEIQVNLSTYNIIQLTFNPLMRIEIEAMKIKLYIYSVYISGSQFVYISAKNSQKIHVICYLYTRFIEYLKFELWVIFIKGFKVKYVIN